MVMMLIPLKLNYSKGICQLLKLTEVDSKQQNIKLCECGCNEIIAELRSDGKPKRFKHGHNRPFPKGKLNPMWNNGDHGSNHPSWKGGRLITPKGYIKIWKPDHPNCDTRGYYFEHRYVMEQYLGRYLGIKEEIHHIDKNKQNNKIENLMLFPNHIEHIRFEFPKKMYNIKMQTQRDGDVSCHKCGKDDDVILAHQLLKNGKMSDEWYCHICARSVE